MSTYDPMYQPIPNLDQIADALNGAYRTADMLMSAGAVEVAAEAVERALKKADDALNWDERLDPEEMFSAIYQGLWQYHSEGLSEHLANLMMSELGFQDSVLD